jgi:putative membrane protein
LPDHCFGTLILSKPMKHKFSINIRFVLGVIAIGCIGLSGTAFAQNPRMFPTPTPSSSGSSEESGTVKSKSDTTANKAKGGTLSSADKAFIKDAAKGGMMEVAMGRVAEKNATDSEVKNFGARMVKDHGKANEELKALAKEEKVELPAEKEAGKWKSDKDYMDMMVKDHEKDLAAFEKEAKDGSDADLKSFASKTAEVVRKHLEMAKEIDGKLK